MTVVTYEDASQSHSSPVNIM